MSSPDVRTAPLFVLALLFGLGAVLLYRAPVRRYVVACERTTTQVVCVLERTTAGDETQRRRVPLGPDAAAAAVVRVMPQRRGPARVLLYLESPIRVAVFAAEFEGTDAAAAAEAAAAQLNQVLQPTSTPGVAAARIEAVPPPILRWVAWGGLGVMGMLILAAYRHLRTRAHASAA